MISAYLQPHCGGGQAGSLTRLDRHKRGGPVPDPSTRGSDWVKAPVQNADGRSFTALVNVPEHLLLDDARRGGAVLPVRRRQRAGQRYLSGLLLAQGAHRRAADGQRQLPDQGGDEVRVWAAAARRYRSERLLPHRCPPRPAGGGGAVPAGALYGSAAAE